MKVLSILAIISILTLSQAQACSEKLIEIGQANVNQLKTLEAVGYASALDVAVANQNLAENKLCLNITDVDALQSLVESYEVKLKHQTAIYNVGLLDQLVLEKTLAEKKYQKDFCIEKMLPRLKTQYEYGQASEEQVYRAAALCKRL